MGGLYCRVRSDSDGQEYLLMGAHDYPSESTLLRLDAELRVQPALRVFGPRALRRLDGEKSCWLLYESFPGAPLEINRSWSAEEFLPFAKKLLAALAACHETGQFHGLLEPSCVLWDRAKGTIGLVGVVPFADRHLVTRFVPNVYSAPELVAGSNAEITELADVYSIGAIFYRLLSGDPPVRVGEGGLEFALIAQAPRALDGLDLPAGLKALIRQMLSKMPSGRPASARLALEALEALDEPCVETLRADDVTRYSVSAVGRETEIGALLGLVRRTRNGESSLVVLRGEPGIGKSFLLRELKQRAEAKVCSLAEGKFAQLRQGRPYSALLEAFRSLLGSILGSVDSEFRYWKEHLASADRSLLGVFAEDLPALQHVTGALPVAPRLGLLETEQRFRVAFRHLLQAFCGAERPLLLILDDVQWADPPTTRLLMEWRANGLPEFMSLFLCLRGEEGKRQPHVSELLVAAEPALDLELQPLTRASIRELCARLFPDCESLDELARLTWAQSGGNPLHAVELLKNFVAQGSLHRSAGAYRFRAGDTRLGSMSDTVVGLVTARLLALESGVRQNLVAAACIGREFSPSLLAIAAGDEPVASAAAAREAVAAGILAFASAEQDTYVFAHDRMQQAALEVGEADFMRLVRLRLGRHYLRGASASRECIYGAVEHLNGVRDSLEPSERAELGKLNWLAALQAKESIAYQRAIALVRLYLDERPDEPELAFTARLTLAECLYLDADYAAAEQALAECRRHASNDSHELRVHYTWLLLAQHRKHYEKALEVGLDALALLDYPLPRWRRLPSVLFELPALLLRTRRLDLESLRASHDRATPHDRSVLEFLVMLWGPSLWTDKLLNVLVVIRLMTLTLRLGNGASAPMAYVCFAVLNHVAFRRYELGVRYSRLALDLLTRHGTSTVAMRVQFLALTFFGAFERSPEENVRSYHAVLKQCLASGEFVAGHLIDGIVTTLPVHGFSLWTIHTELDRCEKLARSIGAPSCLELSSLVRAWSVALADGPEHEGAVFAEQIEHKPYVGVRELLRMQLAYLWNDDATVLELAHRIQNDLVVQANPLHRALFSLLFVLASSRAKRRLGRVGRAALESLRRFASIHPANFRSLSLLAEAEVRRGGAERDAALELYHRAIAEAAERGHELFGAIAAERLATYNELLGDREGFAEYLRVAAFGYTRFGARAMVKRLKVRFPAVEWSWTRSGTPEGHDVDLRLEAVMRAAYAIAEESSSTKLASTLVRVIATAAGAQRAFLIRGGAAHWKILAAWGLDAGEIVPTPVEVESSEVLSQAIVRYVGRTRIRVQLSDGVYAPFAEDPYLSRVQPRCVLCLPLDHRGETSALLYLENSIYSDAFSAEQMQLVALLGRQAAIALSNADNHRLEVEAVQARVNPHFLYNALSTIAHLVNVSPERAEETLLSLARLYRTMLNSTVDRLITLEQELVIVRDYLELEKARFGNKLKVDFQIEPGLGGLCVPALLLQPLVENAVNHGIRRKLDGGTVRVSTSIVGTSLMLSVSDDGPGWYQGSNGNGFGLRSVERRLQILYGERARLQLKPGPGVTVEVQIPVD